MQSKSILLTIPKKLNFLSPYVIKGLVRLGPKQDGGYVVPATLLKKVDFLVSFGMSNDFSFCKDFKSINPKAPIHIYDHSVGLRFFKRQIRQLILNMFFLRFSWKKLKDSISLLISYKSFFVAMCGIFNNVFTIKKNTQAI